MVTGKTSKIDFLPNVDFDDILTNPTLDIAARFWDEDRYEAFRICYRSMRLIDDLVDHQKAATPEMTGEKIASLKQLMDDWVRSIKNRETDDPFGQSMLEVMDKFKIPFWPWQRLHKAMVYDLKNNGFANLTSFLRYSEGAAVAPASVFMHLCGVKITAGNYQKPEFDIRLAARPLALFSYFVHIIRDFEKDQLRNLNYFADSMLSKYNLTYRDLRRTAEGAPVTDSFRRLMGEYRRIANYYRLKARQVLDKIMPLIAPKSQLSLEMIYGLYSQVFERIDPEKGGFSKADLNPNPEEIRKQIKLIIDNFRPFSK
jgi:phytoene/squalene synthetase